MSHTSEETNFKLNELRKTPLENSAIPDVKKYNFRMVATGVAVVLLGVFSGYLLSKTGQTNVTQSSGTSQSSTKTGTGKEEKIFPDQAEGQLEAGGLKGEGTHKLVRSGGDSQTVYLTSSVLDLKQYEGKKVRVWGETHAAKAAGWLMDIGKVEVLQ